MNNNMMSYTTEEEKGTNKVNILGALIITMAIIIIAISGSYAYFSNTVQKVNEENAKVTLKSGVLKMSFETSNYIGLSNVKPIDVIDDGQESQAGLTIDSSKLSNGYVASSGENKKNYTDFSVKFSDTNTVPKAKYELFLTEVKLTENFNNKYVRWALFKTDTSGDTFVAQGDFSTAKRVTDAQIAGDKTYAMQDISLLSEAKVINSTETDSYKLYFWLENDNGVNQSNNCENKPLNTDCYDLREGILSAKVAFRAVSVSDTAVAP